nr:hypothetical protein CFP56_37401 [Quercus suber]
MRTSEKHIPVQQVNTKVQKARSSYVRTIPPRPPDQMPCSDPRPIWKPPPCVIASVAESFHLPFSVVAMEVIATKKALQFAKDLGLSSIILEGDSKIAINGLKSKNSSLNEYDHLLVEAK